MCMKVECPTCQKATWKGCGQHIDAALTGASPTPKDTLAIANHSLTRCFCLQA
ncbi:hypothetical protein PF006_g25118 [Phytophthora fragariae]|uniref:Uncharacterized protein n=1 Tax=Phytophthora fragariae TaxID=53985 RepID=A0A6A3R757_9STRA|nr:hypothetical protein PF003_g6959 [Phytophthora fragariae]KAE9090598.1 hypothetical protein PF006_g25118 [Phytophthora fragariae]